MKAELVRRGITQSDVAKFLGMSPNNLNRKLAETVPMTIDEAKRIRDEFLNDTDIGFLIESDSERFE